jgi:hypothetical protein
LEQKASTTNRLKDNNTHKVETTAEQKSMPPLYKDSISSIKNNNNSSISISSSNNRKIDEQQQQQQQQSNRHVLIDGEISHLIRTTSSGSTTSIMNCMDGRTPTMEHDVIDGNSNSRKKVTFDPSVMNRRSYDKNKHDNTNPENLWISKFPFISNHIRNWNETTVSGWNMARFWVFGMMTPLGILTWTFTHKVSAVVASMLVLPTVAIIQGSLAILNYRVQFGDSPLPKAPSHGIVKCVAQSAANSNHKFNQHSKLDDQDGIGTNHNHYGSASSLSSPDLLGDHDGLLLGDSATSFQGFVDSEYNAFSPSSSSSSSTPLRLLVIGDSLAIGVGQSTCSTPIMPETIAKSLSKAMNGRPVLWTCHGAPGASAGWIVRELERSIKHGQFMQANPPGSSTNNNNKQQSRRDSNSFADGVSCSSSDDSSSAESGEIANPELASLLEAEDHDEELRTWSERLKEHKIRFDPNVLGPFDIAVVLTGSNDLKSAFFPFLLTGEDAEFRRQAQQRGGGYGKELTRILQVLNQRMRIRLQTLRESVEAATERVRESVDNIRERLNSHDMNTLSNGEDYGTSTNRAQSTTATLRRPASRSSGDIESLNHIDTPHQNKDSTNSMESDAMMDGTSHTHTSLHHSPLFPMVVLPGMPARALPIFQSAPLRWLAVPIVDIMDSHKKRIARWHDGEVLFVDAPSREEIVAYSCQSGVHWEDEMDDRVLLNLRGIKRKHARRIESDMQEYFSKKRDQPKRAESLPLRRRHHSMFSVDGIHPNDQGYDFWGRYIAQGIIEEWKRKQLEVGNSL